MFSAGIGKVRDESVIKPEPEIGMKVCKLGGHVSYWYWRW